MMKKPPPKPKRLPPKVIWDDEHWRRLVKAISREDLLTWRLPSVVRRSITPAFSRT